MSKKVTQPSTIVANAMAKVLEQQKAPHWDGDAHAYLLGYIADGCRFPATVEQPDPKDATKKVSVPHPEAGKFDRKQYSQVLAKETPLLYASNTKKWLIDLGDIPSEEVATGGYE